MALSNINKFSPYTSTGQQAPLFPKLGYRFRVLFSKFGGASGISGSGGDANKVLEMTRQVISCGRPDLTMDKKTIELYNSQVHYASKPSWGDISLKLRDDMAGNISKIVGEQIQKQFDFLEQASASSSGDYKFSMHLDMLDGGNGANGPVVLESWELTGCFISKATYSELDYSKTDPMDISLTISMDNAIQTNGAGTAAEGIGSSVGRATGNMLAP